jgi:outer membrane protein TolC
MLISFIASLQAGLSLQDCRVKALEANLKLQIADSDMDSATAIKKASFTAFLPRFSATGSYTHINEKLRLNEDLHLDEILAGMAQANPGLVSDPFYATLHGMVQQGLLPSELELELGKENNYLMSVQVTQPLFTGGKIVQQYEIAKSLEAIAKDRKTLSRSQLILDTDEAYWRVLSLEEKLQLARQYKNLVQQHLGDLENALEVGIVTQNEILKAQVKLNEAELSIIKAVGGLKLARMALNQIIGMPLSEEPELSDSWQEEAPVILDDTEVGKAIAQRPELAMLKENARISKALTRVAKSSFYPMLGLEANYHMLSPNPYNSLETEFGSDWQISLVAEMELFHFGERVQKLKAAKANGKTAVMQVQETEQLLELQLRQAKNQYLEAEQSLKISKSAMEQAIENLRVCQQRFDAGMLRSSELIEAQTLWQKANSDWIDAKNDLRIKSSIYKKAIGEL